MADATKGSARSAGAYKVGHGKPPEEFRFGRRPQPERAKRPFNEQRPDIAALLERPMQVKLNGKTGQNAST